MLKIIGASVLAMSIVGAPNFVFAQGAKAPYKIAVIASYTGPASGILGAGGRGFEAYFDYANRNGGINGHRIELQVLDDQTSASVGNGLIERAVSGSPLAIGHFGLSTSLTQSKSVWESVPMPIISATADDSLLYPTPAKDIFMANLSARQQAEALVKQSEQIIGDVKGKKFAIALAQSSYNDSMAAAFRKQAEANAFQIVALERFALGVPSFSSQSAKIARLKPDVAIAIAVSGDAPIVAGGMSNAGVTDSPIMGYSASSSNEVFRKLNLPNYYAYRPYSIAAELPGLGSKVSDSYKGSMTGALFTLGWAAAEVIADAIAKCGDACDGRKMVDAMERGEPVQVEPGVLYGPVLFSKTRHTGLTRVQSFKLDGDRVVTSGVPINIGE